MSEARDLNHLPDPEPAGNENEIEELLRSLVPRSPALNRDVLFFQAGMAAAHRESARGRFARAVWPAVAAMLLVACGGLAMELARKSTALETALAAVASPPAATLAADDTPAGQGAAERGQNSPAVAPPTPRAHGNRFGWRQRSRDVEQTFFSDRTPGGQLTAVGWTKGQPIDAAAEADAAPAPDEPPTRPARRPSYGELMRSLGG